MRLTLKEDDQFDKFVARLDDFLDDEIYSEFESELAKKVASKLTEYDPDWCADLDSNELTKARRVYLDAIRNNLIANLFKK